MENYSIRCNLWKRACWNLCWKQVVIEARSELVDVETNPIGSRDFTYCLFLPGIEYTENPNDTAVVNVDSSV